MKSIRQLKIQFWNSGEILDWTYVIGSDWHIDGTRILGMDEITQGVWETRRKEYKMPTFLWIEKEESRRNPWKSQKGKEKNRRGQYPESRGREEFSFFLHQL